MRLRYALALALSTLTIATCAWLPPTIHPDADRVRWAQEPTIGTDEPTFQDRTREAVEAWGVGSYVPTCRGADICVRLDALTFDDRAWGRARWPGEHNRCDALIRVQHYVVIPHEIGHCLGLGHSTDRRSFMYPDVPAYSVEEVPFWVQFVTRQDREAAQALFR